jgi:hypothetical protein
VKPQRLLETLNKCIVNKKSDWDTNFVIGLDPADSECRVEFELLRARGGCLGAESRRRTWWAAKSHGELPAGFDPWISEWGNPAGVMPGYQQLNI